MSKNEQQGKKVLKAVAAPATVEKEEERSYVRNRSCDTVLETGAKQQHATLRQRFSSGGGDSGEGHNAVTRRLSSSRSSGGSVSGSGKTYRRLYVTKVRNSKVYEHDFDIATEAAKIAQRVDNDVLPEVGKLRSTDLKLLP